MGHGEYEDKQNGLQGRPDDSETHQDGQALKGNQALLMLAQRFPQLYVAPAEDAQEAHRLASRRGIAPKDASLSHFLGSPDDELRQVATPAGPIEVLFLAQRRDFETFLQIIGHKSSPVPIARTVGAITYRGLADWAKVAAAHEAYRDRGGTDWNAEFARLAKEPGAFRGEIIVISEGPYSNVSADETPYDPDEWLRVSREIRLHHECAHVVCRRLIPEDVLPVWDEVTADVVGLLAATDGYDSQLAAKFLGVTATGFADGRLAEYLSQDQLENIDAIAAEVHGACECIARLAGPAQVADPFAFLLDLKRNPLVAY